MSGIEGSRIEVLGAVEGWWLAGFVTRDQWVGLETSLVGFAVRDQSLSLEWEGSGCQHGSIMMKSR
jgi:hypothetical protein